MPDAKCGFEGDSRGPAQQLLVQLGPTLIVDVGFDPNFKPGIGTNPILQLKGSHALVDTGATQSCIDSGVAGTLQLPIVDRQKVSGVGGVHEVNMHLAQIHVPELDVNIIGSFAGVDLAAGGQPHIVLIGRTFLQHVTLLYEGTTGKVTITKI
jgi:predicted aspartyl protease